MQNKNILTMIGTLVIGGILGTTMTFAAIQQNPEGYSDLFKPGMKTNGSMNQGGQNQEGQNKGGMGQGMGPGMNQGMKGMNGGQNMGGMSQEGMDRPNQGMGSESPRLKFPQPGQSQE